ncbi:hypothetical protein F4824DRAFT_36151 [Ustulina deusta]|nr:hypothetical protein F4824DRAFT_36151 [Ustulina deusta]
MTRACTWLAPAMLFTPTKQMTMAQVHCEKTATARVENILFYNSFSVRFVIFLTPRHFFFFFFFFKENSYPDKSASEDV